ncbi:ribonuclease Z [Paenibacillus sp. 32O-W]|uniref:ribonuclease Z n=1 Tax=Paenibacillus sp. 32O-W TaxID=1695218 RepID=UPI00071EBDF0|nr:ribonuclease Z [Paenibacillus sp. 32O-W]ALS27935.1 ribonuclease Z [Paenibacillus sp. 32O-W]
MELLFLGTGAGRPSKDRNVSAAALVFPERGGAFWLFDAGEGTQHQLMRTSLKLNKLEAVFITHLHGDHLFGLPGLLSSRSYHEGAGDLPLFGPPGIKSFLDAVFAITGTHLEYRLDIREAVAGPIWDDGTWSVRCAPLDHRVPCLGYRIEERDRPGRLDSERAKQLGVPFGPLFGALKRGEDVELPDGTIVRSRDVVGPPIKGRVVTLLGDTKPCPEAVLLAEGADLLVHEATFAAGMEEKAAKYGHSTTGQAAETAKKAGAKRLVMTHFSHRYRMEDLASLENEARKVFPETVAAYDLKAIDIPFRSE